MDELRPWTEIDLPKYSQKYRGISYDVDTSTPEKAAQWEEYLRYTVEELKKFECCQTCKFWRARLSRFGSCVFSGPQRVNDNETPASYWCGQWTKTPTERKWTLLEDWGDGLQNKIKR
mgnify:CR=1 FL=1